MSLHSPLQIWASLSSVTVYRALGVVTAVHFHMLYAFQACCLVESV